MEAVAVTKYLRGSARKARLVADLIRGKKVGEALAILSFTPKASAKLISKTLKSAVANAGQKKGVDVDNLIVKKVLVDGGPTLKRFQARAMGRGVRILKRTCHIKVILEEI